MKFIDEATIRVRAGNGGNGVAAFRREKYIPKGFDLIIIKDVIQHWTDEDILSFFGEILDKILR